MQKLTPEQLRRRVDPAQLPVPRATAGEFSAVIGQTRAVDAVQLGIGMAHHGYNLFVMGEPGVGKSTYVRHVLEQRAATEATPSDWCYVHNFVDPHKPRALQLPSGSGRKLRDDMRQLVEELHHFIPAAFDTDQYRSKVQEIEQDLKQREEAEFDRLQQDAAKRRIHLFRTPTGYAFAPSRNGTVLEPEEFEKLPKKEQDEIERETEKLQAQLEEFIRGLSRLRRERRARIKQLNRDITMAAVNQILYELKKDYDDLPAVVQYLDAVEQDVIENAENFRHPEEPSPQFPLAVDHGGLLRRYGVNVLVDHSATHGAPIVHETLPTHQNLVGRIEHLSQLGALFTDFLLIKPGALHTANGGYLVLDARKVLSQPYAWDGLKRVLQSGKIQIESLGQILGFISTVSLEPEPIPLKIKIVLLGERILYYLLAELDPEFAELFKVPADFEDTMPWSADSHQLYAQLLDSLCQREKLCNFERGAIAQVIEHSARLSGDAQKLSMHLGNIVDVMREADHHARQAGRGNVTGGDVETVVAARAYRLNRLRDVILDEIRKNVILIDDRGEKIAQVNGLAVIDVGEHAFAHPSRITATVRMGEGEIINIERDVELSGAIHSKGVMILSAFLSTRYAMEHPLSLSATLAFEQTYGAVDGDSASMAELAALLSALAQLPIKQSLAITGSVNQHGQIQAIGAVNEKIEGFFDVCSLRGLTGDHGVLIPASNQQHLMLRRDVVEAVAAGRFHVYAFATADEAMALLTGVPAGARDVNGVFPEGSVNRRVEERLAHYADARHAYEGKLKES